MSKRNSVYWEDLVEDLKDPEFLREYVLESLRIHSIDSIINQLDEAREAAGLSKADLARVISAQPSTVRRLLGTTTASNPTLGTVSEVAASLGMQLALVPIPDSEASIPQALQTGTIDDPSDVLHALERLMDDRELVQA